MTLAGSYLDIDGLKARTIAPPELVDGTFLPSADTDDIAAWVTFVESTLIIMTSWINSRLAKRYATPFADPAPEVVNGWLAALVTPRLYQRRGWDPSDDQAAAIIAEAATAKAEALEAANSETGLYDLPLRQDLPQVSAITMGGPYAYSEASPYTWTDVQACILRNGGS